MQFRCQQMIYRKMLRNTRSGEEKEKRGKNKKNKNKVLGDKCIVVMYDQPKQQQLQLRIPSVSSFSISLSLSI